MTPLPFDQPVPRIVFAVMLAAFALGEVVIRIATNRNRAKGSTELASLGVVIAGFGLGLGGGFLIATHLSWAAIPAGRLALFIGGIALMVLGLVIRFWAVIALGRNFTVFVQVRDDQPVVATGPYRLVRHPSYTGLLLVCLGIGLALGNWLALLAVAVLPTAAILIRIRVEERALLAGIGEPYRRFAATRKRLIPWVW